MYDLIEQHYRNNFDKIVATFTPRYGAHNAEDIVQEAYARACQYFYSYNPDTEFENWFSRILSRSVISHYRDTPDDDPYDYTEDDWAVDGRADTYTIAVANELREGVERLLSVKKERQQQMVRLLVFDENTVYQTARALHVNPQKVWSALRRFRRELKESGLV